MLDLFSTLIYRFEKLMHCIQTLLYLRVLDRIILRSFCLPVMVWFLQNNRNVDNLSLVSPLKDALFMYAENVVLNTMVECGRITLIFFNVKKSYEGSFFCHNSPVRMIESLLSLPHKFSLKPL